MADLRVAVDTISNKADEYDSAEAERSISRHLETIDRLCRERAETYTALRESREAETAGRQAGPYVGTLAAIAQEVDRDKVTHGWLVDHVTVLPDRTPPVTNDEAVEWLALLNDLDIAADERESQSLFPDLGSIPGPDEIAHLIDAEAAASEYADMHSSWRGHALFPDIEALDDETRKSLHARTSELAKALDDLESRSEGWVADAVQDIRTGRRQTWQARADQVADLIERARPYVEALGPLAQVQAPQESLPTHAAMARALRDHLAVGATIRLNADGTPKIGAFASKVLRQSQGFFESVRVNGLPAATAEGIDTFLSFADGAQVLDSLDRAWPASISIPEEDTLDERLQWHVTELGQLSKVLSMADKLAATEDWVKTHRLKAPDWASLTDVQSYAALVDAATSADLLSKAQSPLATLQNELATQAAWANSSPVVAALLDALTSRDRNGYRAGFERLTHLHEIRNRVRRRDALTSQLAHTAPRLVDAVRSTPLDSTWNSRLASLSQAWGWAGAALWLRAQETTRVNQLQRRLDAIESQLRTEIEALAADRAWAHAVDESRMSGTARAYLRQYAGLVRRLGKGTGKYAAKQRQEIKAALDQCRPSVPVWIMPIYRIAEQLRITSNMFDVVLVDEASQAGLEAAFLQYLAPKIIVVGDDKQVSPSAVGVDQQQLRDLANQYLPTNPFKASWQDPKRSYFDEASMRFGGKITLIEHRRCVPEIIGFSNKIAYEPDNIRLLPVRQRPAGALPPIKRVHVPSGYEKGKTNPAEADAIVEAIVQCKNDPAYEGKTFGVISLSGKEQAKLISNKLLEAIHPDDWTTRDLRCGDAADFQGSERDVMFLSMVKAAGAGRVGAATTEMYIQRYNVAASRAKDQMWLFHSLLLGDLGNPADMRHALLDYVSNVEARQDHADERILKDLVPDDYRVAPFDSLFEQRVFNRIHGRGYSVIPQYPVEGYKIDLVVVGVNGNLAIECDGDTWHGPEHYLKDLARQRDLERCGWTFFRIRESSFYLDPEEALAELWPQLEALTAVAEEVSDDVLKEISEEPSLESPTSSDLAELPAYAALHAAVVIQDAVASQSSEANVVATEESPESAFVPIDESEPEESDLARRSFNSRDKAGTVASGDGYEQYSGPARPTQISTKAEVIDALVEIVRVEGPVRGSRLQTAYVKASGGHKVGSQIARDLNSAITLAVRQNRLVEDNPLGESGVKPKTYRLPDQPLARVRPLGPRALEEVPPLELAARLRAAREESGPYASESSLYRAVLDALGLKRLTPNVTQLLAVAHTLVDRIGPV